MTKEIEDSKFKKLTDIQLLALCIWGEARGESYVGKVAVGSVILNRVDKGGWFGKSLKGVILKPYQFSCFLKNDPNYPILLKIAQNFDGYTNKTLDECETIAIDLYHDGKRNTEATHYKTLDCRASWENKLKLVATIGNHNFYI